MAIKIEEIGQGASCVLFHGWGFDHTIWLNLARTLASRYHFYLVDLPGFGGTSPLKWDDFRNQLLNVLPEKFSVIGWSLGGLYAMRLAIDSPVHISHLINVASSPQFFSEAHWPGILPHNLNHFYSQLQQKPAETIQQFIQLQGIDSRDLGSFATTSKGLQMGLGMLSSWNLRPRIHELSMPTAFLLGRLDRIVPAKTLVALQASYPQFFYYLFKKAGHIPFLTCEDEFITVLTNFLDN